MSMTWLAMVICVVCSGAVRSRSALSAVAEMDAVVHGDPYTVKLLITRHGLSCANIAQKWVGDLEGGRGSIHDTLLGGAGEQACIDSARDVKTWLENNNLEIDAVVSSVLGRAMQTALLMFPDDTAPLHVVPWIRESGSGLSNSPKERLPQRESLERAMHSNLSHRLDYRWTDRFGAGMGTWSEFLNFMEQFFLPELIKRLEKPGGSTIVIPVVTHSNFLKEQVSITEKCGYTWKVKGKKKPLNNQVVDMVYNFDMDRPPLQVPTSSAVFTILDCGEEQLNGAWMQGEGLESGRVHYYKMEDKNQKLQWSKKRTAWRFFTDNAAGFARPTLFMSFTDKRAVPDDDSWQGACDCPNCNCDSPRSVTDFFSAGPTCECNGKGPAPRIVFQKKSYSLQQAPDPCIEVSSGQSLDDKHGQRRKLCDRDIGATCAPEFKAHLWSNQMSMITTTVEDGTYEAELTTAKTKLRDAANQYHEDSVKFLKMVTLLNGTPHRTEEIEIRLDGPNGNVVFVQNEKFLQRQLDAAIAIEAALRGMISQEPIIDAEKTKIENLSKGTCLSGGKPDVPDYPP